MNTDTELTLLRGDAALNEAEHTCGFDDVKQGYLNDAFTSLEGIADTLQRLTDDGEAMSPALASTSRATIEHVSGGAISGDLISLEGHDDAVHQTQVSLESLLDTLKSLWEKIRLAIKNALRALVDFIEKMISGLGGVENAIEKMRRMNKAQDKAISQAEDDIIEGPWARLEITSPERLMIRGKVDLSIIQQGTEVIRKELLNTTFEYAGLIGQYYEQIESVVAAGQPLSTDVFNEFVAKNGDIVKNADSTNRKLLSNTVFPGDKQIKIKVREVDEYVLLGGIDIVTDSRARDMSKTFVPTPNAKFVDDILAAAQEIVEKLKESQDKSRLSLLKQREQLVERMNGIYQGFDADTSSVDGKRFRKYVKAIDKDHVRSLSKIDRFAFSYVRALMDTMSTVLKLKSKAMKKKGIRM